MSFLDIDTTEQPNTAGLSNLLQSLPIVGGIASLGYQPDNKPIIQKLPQTQASFERKYAPDGPLASVLRTIPVPYSNALVELDRLRANRGQSPLSEKQTANVLATAMKGEQATKEPSPGFLGGIVSDIKQLGASVPHIPQALIGEVRDLGNIQQHIDENPGIAGLLTAPGIRLLPGTYTAANILGGTPEELVNHPVFTFLDLLPGLQKAGAGRVAKRALAPVSTGLSKTRAGSIFAATFGKDAKAVSELAGLQTLRLERDIRTGSPATFQAQDAWTQNTRRAYDLIERSRKEYNLNPKEIADVYDSLTLGDKSGLSDRQLALRTQFEDISNEFTRLRTNEGFLKSIDGELYDRRTAGRIMRYRRAAVNANLAGEVRRFVDPSITDGQYGRITPELASDRLAELRKMVADGTTTPEQARVIERGYITALRHQGYDTGFYSKLNGAVRSKKLSEAGRIAAVDDAVSNLRGVSGRPVDAIPDLLQRLQQRVDLAPADYKVRNIQEAIRSGNYTRAKQLAREVSKRKLATIPDIEQIVDDLTSHREVGSYLDKTKGFNPKAVASVARKAEQVYAESVPPRLIPLVKERVNQSIQEMYSTNPNFDELLPLIKQRHYELIPGFGSDDLARITNETKRTWQQLRDELPADQQPIFIHQVTPDRVPQIEARPLEHITKESALIDRVFDNTTYTKDAAIALSHQGVEKLRRIHSEALAEQITTSFGRDKVRLIEEYLPEAQQRAAREGISERQALETLLKRDYVKYDPETLFTFTSPRLKQFAEQEIFIPKTIADVLQKMHTPPGGRVSAIFDPVMRVFRTSILPLSPRWHINNVVSGAIMLSAEDGPQILAYGQRAKEALKNGEIPLEAGVGTGAGSIPRELAVDRYNLGRTLRQRLDETAIGGTTVGVREGFGNLVQRSYRLNEMVDDLYRSMAYLYGHDKQYAKLMKQGDIDTTLAKEQAQQAGIELAKKVMPNWLNMTPIERTVIRNIFPFYGWVRHILKYAMSYPVDHPTRTAIVGSLARSELDDRGILPDKFMNNLFFGGLSPSGERKSINTTALNPFSDVARYFTLAGFLGSTNPIIATVLKSAGVNAATGTADTFPNTRYDPTTGRNVAASGNILTNFIQSTVPQTRLAFDLFSRNSEFKQQLVTDPDAAIGRVQSTFGMPRIYDVINEPTEIYKAELARMEAENNAKNEALRSGSDVEANRFPGLIPLMAQIRTLQAQGQMAPYEPNLPMPSILQLTQRTLLGKLQG